MASTHTPLPVPGVFSVVIALALVDRRKTREAEDMPKILEPPKERIPVERARQLALSDLRHLLVPQVVLGLVSALELVDQKMAHKGVLPVREHPGQRMPQLDSGHTLLKSLPHLDMVKRDLLCLAARPAVSKILRQNGASASTTM
jgi:hypothetical protein